MLKIPRSPKDNVKRARFVGALCNSLLEWYDAFIYVDVDEILVADPTKYRNLLAYVSAVHDGTVIHAYGFDVCHELSEEAPIRLSEPILRQRRWIRFSSSMCKPVLSFRPINWAPGFHSADCELSFDGLYLFHLRYFDLGLGLVKLRRTRAMPWADPAAGSHQRVPDDQFEDLMRVASGLPKISNVSLQPNEPPLSAYIEGVRASERDFRTNLYNIDLHIFGDHLLEIPRELRDHF
jgi:hypothetical protein